jgi:murein DD-endopeptidase MepM/ murein hydrolase activator NlpD
MMRFGFVQRLMTKAAAAACVTTLAACIPTLPDFGGIEPASGTGETAQSEPEKASIESNETTQVTAAPAPDVAIDVLDQPNKSTKAKPAPTRSMPTARPSGDEVIVPAGKTLYAIARERDVAVRDLIELNGLTPPYKLLTGQRLKLPIGRVYKVQPGDTLDAVARREGVDLRSLVRLNGLEKPYALVAGSRLKLPAPNEPLDPEVASALEADTYAEAEPAYEPAPKPPARPAEIVDAKRARVAAERSRQEAGINPSARASEPPPRAGASFFWPVKGQVVSRFGPQGGGVQSDGITIVVPRGTPVKAAENGVVAYAGSDLKAYGKLILVRHAGGWMTAYAHNDALMVKEGDMVRRGQVISRAGTSGSVKDPQTYFEIRHRGKPVDPLDHLVTS